MSTSTPNVLPGSQRELELAESLRKVFKELADSVDYVSVPVYTWNYECAITVGDVEKPCALLPYSSGVELDTGPNGVIKAPYEELLEKDLAGKIVLMEYPKKPEELRVAIYSLAKKNPEAIVLVPGNYLKADVVLGSPGFSRAPSVPLHIPVLSVDSETALAMLEKRFSITASHRLERGSSRILLARVNGSGENDVHVVAHHDALLGSPESASSSLLPRFLEKARRADLPVNLVVVSYTARDVGDLEFTEYHYTWGERYLLRILEARGELDKVSYAVALGPLHSTGQLTVHAHPALYDYFARLISRVDFNHMFMESGPYVEHGVAAATITTLPETWIHHNATTQQGINSVEAEKLLEMLLALIREIKPSAEWLEKIRKYTEMKLGEARLEVRVAASRLLDAASLSRNLGGLREALKAAYVAAYAACTKPLKAYSEASLFSPLSQEMLRAVGGYLVECRGDVVVCYSEACSPYSPRGSASSKIFIEGYLNYWVNRLKDSVERAVLRLLCMKEAGGSSGMEEHKNRQVQGL